MKPVLAFLCLLALFLVQGCITRNLHQAPANRIKEDQIRVFTNRLVIESPNQIIFGRITSSKSMLPTLDQGHYTIEIASPPQSDLRVGDIISYRIDNFLILHRIREIGFDQKGWYAITQGDHSDEPDPKPVRYSQIAGVVIAIIF